MATHTTLEDFAEYAGESYSSSQDARIERMLPLAERMLLRRVQTDFYVAGTDAGEDWIFAICVIADFLMTYDDPEVRADIAGPYQSERLGDWAFTLRKDMWTPFQDLRIRSIIRQYSVAQTIPSVFFITTVGPLPYGGETTER